MTKGTLFASEQPDPGVVSVIYQIIGFLVWTGVIRFMNERINTGSLG